MQVERGHEVEVVGQARQGGGETPDDGGCRHQLRARVAVAEPTEERREDCEGEEQRRLHVAEFRVGQPERGVFQDDGRDRRQDLPVNVVEEVDQREHGQRVVRVARDSSAVPALARRRFGDGRGLVWSSHPVASAEVSSSTMTGVMSASVRTRRATRALPGPQASVGTWLSVWLREERSSTLPWSLVKMTVVRERSTLSSAVRTKRARLPSTSSAPSRFCSWPTRSVRKCS